MRNGPLETERSQIERNGTGEACFFSAATHNPDGFVQSPNSRCANAAQQGARQQAPQRHLADARRRSRALNGAVATDKEEERMIQFLVHEKADNVGVATVDIKKGEKAAGLYMDSQKKVETKALQDIPLGHKIALTDLKKEDSVIKYGHDIGRVVASIKTGEHVHIHNLKTRRW
jgi:(2R)-sulfolactate sulfo-lyase subunit alpha